MAASAAHQGKPGGGTVSQNKNKNKSSTATSGWKKGFFGQSFTATGKTKSNVKAHADADIIEDNNKLKQAEGSSSLPNISAESTTAPILSTTSSTTGTAAAAHTAVKFALPADDASTTLTTPAVDTAGQAPQPQTAFSGSIFERTPAGPTLPLPGGGAAGGHKLLGPKARLGGKMS